jgi:hypothetical protein
VGFFFSGTVTVTVVDATLRKAKGSREPTEATEGGRTATTTMTNDDEQ